MCRLDYEGYAYPVESLGPGQRIAIWVRGCQRHCAGCLTPELWEPGEARPVAEIADELAPLLEKADGISISGGEPFMQAKALTHLIEQLQRHSDPEIMVYSGYLLEEIQEHGGEWAALLAKIDILIDGPFVESLPNTLQWRGSDNQRAHLLSSRAQRYAGQVDLQMPEARPLQIQPLGNGQYRIIGIPRRGDMTVYRTAMAQRGIHIVADYE